MHRVFTRTPSLRSIFATLFATYFLHTASAGADSLPNVISMMDVMSNTLAHHPKLSSLDAKLEQTAAEQLAAQGNFDWQIEYSQQNRTSGFYDGWFGDQRISRQLGWANAKFSTGYRISDGDFPVYEQYHRTLDDGEPNVKLSMSLLKYRSTDPKRQELIQSQLRFERDEQLQTLDVNDLLRDAAFYFLDWQQSYHEVTVARNLLTLAEQRNRAIEARVRTGDLALLEETEFQTTLLQRRANVLEKEQKLASAALKLSLYWRDETGVPRRLHDNEKPDSLRESGQILQQHLSALPENIKDHPQLRAFALFQKKLQEERRLASSELLPQVDLDAWLARDIGNGSETLDGNESYVGLRVSVPLERRKAKGKLRAIDAKIKAAGFDQQQMRELMVNFIETELLDIQNLNALLKTQERQTELAAKLADLERRRFAEGDSDLFILNNREIALAQAELEVIRTRTDIKRKQINLLSEAALLVPVAL